MRVLGACQHVWVNPRKTCQAGILKIVDGYSARALRVLAIAARPMSKLPCPGELWGRGAFMPTNRIIRIGGVPHVFNMEDSHS